MADKLHEACGPTGILYKTPAQATPYLLVIGEVVIPLEVQFLSLRSQSIN